MDADALRLTLIDRLVLEAAAETAARLPFSQRLATEGFPEAPSCWGLVPAAGLRAAVVGLLQGASGALGAEGHIRLACVVEPNQVGILIRDNGDGTEGSRGPAVAHAKSVVESFGGRLRVDAKPGLGTSVVLALPLDHEPAWSVSELRVPDGETLVICDPESGPRGYWRMRSNGCLFRAFPTLGELEAELPALGDPAKLTFVLEQFAGEPVTGLDFARKHGLAARTVLCTGLYDDPAVQRAVGELGMRMIPKARLAAVRVNTD